jgi:hypothetical protein
VSIPEYRTPHYTLVDDESHNEIGIYRSRIAALRAVADTVQRYGIDSSAVRSLSLARDDVSDEEGFIASGRELARLALAAVGVRKDAHAVQSRVMRLAATSGDLADGLRARRAARARS